MVFKMKNKDQQKFTADIFLPKTNISEFLVKADKKSEWATTGKTTEERAELFWHLSRLCRRKIKGVSGDAKGVP